jgi:pilus assembly protein TadC
VISIAFLKYFTSKFPDLPYKLKKANMLDTAEEFVKKTIISAIYTTFGLEFIIFLLLSKSLPFLHLLIVMLFSFVFLFFFMFFYFFQLPMIKINRVDKEINKEIVFAGRFLIVELESGVSLYDSMKNMGKSYPVVGAYFTEIVNKINVGTPMEDAITEVIESNPSPALTKILWQVSNSLRTGSDVAEPLKTVVETLIKEQRIMVNEYGRKLNPLAMFYMLIAIIMPSLGVTMLTIFSIFIGIKLNLVILLTISFVIGFLQFMFIAMINSIRPPVEF